MRTRQEEYWSHLKSIEWEKLRRQALHRAQFRCERERPGGPRHDGPLELHHLHYDTVGYETLDDVELVCQSCHRDAHAPRNRRKRMLENYGQQRLFDRWTEPAVQHDLDDAA